ncbi:ABC transporter ATP-binding protein [Metabacillus flavus]|uniref:ABC transporter ATP-binding protein n=1 Tax=Metabacillus flavus TaxID=2823519 RepID=UPI0020167265|nr:ABC transporter ATP-binding protein [Metabacillus flavus]
MRSLWKEYGSAAEFKKAVHLLKPYVLCYKKEYLFLLILLLGDIFFTILFAWFFGTVTDAAVHGDFYKMKWLAAIGGILIASSIASNFLYTYLETIAINSVKRDLNLQLYRHMLVLPKSSLSINHSGDLVSHFTNDLHQIDSVIGSGLLNLLRFPLISLTVFLYLLNMNWVMTVSILILTPAAAAGGAFFGLKIRNNSREINKSITRILKHLNETFQGMDVIRAFTLERVFYQKYKNENNTLYDWELKEAKWRGWFNAGGEALGSAAFLGCLLMGSFFVARGNLTIGSLFTFISLISHLVSPMTGLAAQWAGYQRSLISLERISLILEKPSESQDLPSYQPASSNGISIQLNDLSFTYDNHSKVLRNLNAVIPSNSTVAIVGPSGAGKSTLSQLLMGFYKPHTGDILFNEKPINAYTPAELRNLIAYVPQESFLFSGTIRENLKLARPDSSDEEMIQACIDAYIHQVIMQFPNGYDTEIGERGIKVSGGQRQRIAIARAILRGAPILLLDEATSALDNESEHQVKRVLKQAKQKRTLLIIAHRLTTIRHADLVIVMDKGEIIQMGKHTDLVQRKGLYQTLYAKDEISFESAAGVKHG